MDKYRTIDTEGLASELANDKWNDEVQSVPDEDLNEMIVEGNEMKKQVRPHWASKFFALKELYHKLIISFEKEIRDSKE